MRPLQPPSLWDHIAHFIDSWPPNWGLLVLAGLGSAVVVGVIGALILYFLLFHVFADREDGQYRYIVRFELKQHVLSEYVTTEIRWGLRHREVLSEELEYSVNLANVRFASAYSQHPKGERLVSVWDRDPGLIHDWDRGPKKMTEPMVTNRGARILATFAPSELSRQPEIHREVIDYLNDRASKNEFDLNVSLETGVQHTWKFEPLGEKSTVFA
jgi:hypothetical protein